MARVIQFARETVANIQSDIVPLIQKHYEEIARFKDIRLDPNFDHYSRVEQIGSLRIYTARDENQKLLGYQIYFVYPHPHFKTSLHATQDILFVDQEVRGFGHRFMKWCLDQLRQENIEVVTQSTTSRLDFGPILKRLGFEHSENIYTRRL